MELPTHRRERTVYVNNIIRNTTEDDLFTLFQKAGPVEKVIFKNVDGTPQHALVVFRRLDSVMICLENSEHFRLKGQQLGMRPLKESKLSSNSSKPIPASAGYDTMKRKHFSFDMGNIQHLQLRSDSEARLSSSYLDHFQSAPPPSPLAFQLPRSPQIAMPSTSLSRKSAKPAPLSLSKNNNSFNWGLSGNREATAEPFTAPPYSAPVRFNFPSSFDRFPGI